MAAAFNDDDAGRVSGEEDIMPKTLDARLNAAERILGGPGSRLAYSHAQWVRVGELVRAGVPVSEVWERIGPPEQVLAAGRPSHAELIAEAAGLLPPRHGRRPPEPQRLVDVVVDGKPQRLTEPGEE